MRKIEVDSIVLFNKDEDNPLKVYEITPGGFATCLYTKTERTNPQAELYPVALLMDVRDFWDEKRPGWENIKL